MPNLLAHCGVQGVLTHTLIKGAPPAWITVGCLIPDVPWILARMAKIVIPPSAAYDLQLYAIVQSSFILYLLLAVVLAFLSRHPVFVFLYPRPQRRRPPVARRQPDQVGQRRALFCPFDMDAAQLGLVLA